MNVLNLIRIALRALQRNKLRAFLTMLGIIIGVGSVITMVAIGQGSKKSIQDALSSMGSNMITIRPNSNVTGGGQAGCLERTNPDDRRRARSAKAGAAYSCDFSCALG